MKKFSMFITLCIATLLLISCSNTKDKNNISTNDSESKKSIIPVEEYNVLTYMQSFSGSSSYGENQYTGPQLHYESITKDENANEKMYHYSAKITMFIIVEQSVLKNAIMPLTNITRL